MLFDLLGHGPAMLDDRTFALAELLPNDLDRKQSLISHLRLPWLLSGVLEGPTLAVFHATSPEIN